MKTISITSTIKIATMTSNSMVIPTHQSGIRSKIQIKNQNKTFIPLPNPLKKRLILNQPLNNSCQPIKSQLNSNRFSKISHWKNNNQYSVIKSLVGELLQEGDKDDLSCQIIFLQKGLLTLCLCYY